MTEGMHEPLTLDIFPNVKYIICINIKENKHLESYKRLGMLGMGGGVRHNADTFTKTFCAWVLNLGLKVSSTCEHCSLASLFLFRLNQWTLSSYSTHLTQGFFLHPQQ